MIKNIGCLIIGCNGTAGHTTLIKSVVEELIKIKKHNLFIYAEPPNILKSKYKNISFKHLIKQDVNSTVGGCLDYKDKNKLFQRIQKHKIDLIIVSTFFDKELMLKLKDDGIKTILINYPLRDTHKNAFLLKKYYKCFDAIYTLKGISNMNKIFPNEHILSPIKPRKGPEQNKKNSNGKFNILVTCGGGGLSSSKIFFEIIKYLIKEISEENIKFNIIKGNADFHVPPKKNINVIKWTKDFNNLLNKNDLIISEAGYFTFLDLLLTKTPAIMIPGKRGIDNQELRAVKFELLGAGKVHFPFQKKENLKKIILEIIKNNSQIDKFNMSKKIISQDIFEDKTIIDNLLEELK